MTPQSTCALCPRPVPTTTPTGTLQGIMRVQLDSGVPVIFGVLCVLTEEQALVRAGVRPGMHNHGVEWAQAALQMAGYSHCPAIVTSGTKLAKW